jgi:SAM-dependent methyltransferase
MYELFEPAIPDIASLLAESDFCGTYRDWERWRRPLAGFIEWGESVLDVGCANGFLLACLMAWHYRGFVPHGFDLNPARIKVARALLIDFAQNFHVRNLRDPIWPGPRVDVIIAPWIEHGPFIMNCLRYSRTRVLFTAYDDQIARGVDVFEGCERNDLIVAEKYVFADVLQIAAVEGMESNSPRGSNIGVPHEPSLQ